MATELAELLGEADACARAGGGARRRFARLRDSLSKSRRALTEQIAAAAFDPADDLAWERLEEALIQADVGVPATAELVRRLEARGELGDLGAALAEEVAALLRRAAALDVAAAPERDPRRRRQRHGQDDDDRQARAELSEHGRSVVVARRRHVPRRGGGAARDLGAARRRRLRRQRARRRPRRRRLRRDRGGAGARARRRDRRHRRPPAHADEPDGGAREGAPGDRGPARRARRTRRCSSSTRRPVRTACSRRGSSARPRASPVSR